MKNFIIAIVVIILAGVGIYFVTKSLTMPKNPEVSTTETTQEIATTTEEQNPSQAIIGQSVEGRDIVAYNFGTGSTKLLFVGGIHRADME